MSSRTKFDLEILVFLLFLRIWDKVLAEQAVNGQQGGDWQQGSQQGSQQGAWQQSPQKPQTQYLPPGNTGYRY